MALRVADVVSLRSSEHPQAHTRRSPGVHSPIREGTSRRRFLGGVAAVSTALALAALGIFPPAREAFADGYDVWTSTTTGPCGSGGYAVNHNCSPGCGPSAVCSGGSNGTCCNTNVWHCTGGDGCAGPNQYSLRPNECYQSFYDAWMWKCSSTLKYRCHDGWTCILHGGCVRTICRKSIAI